MKEKATMNDPWIKEEIDILFIGDSITDCGRCGDDAPYGNGYMNIYRELVIAEYPERAVRYFNKGISGNRITDLKERWWDDVLFHRPDRLSIKIGINDLHSFLRGGLDAVSPALFEETYDELLEVTRVELGCPVMLLTPFYISTDVTRGTFRSQVLDLIPQYINVVLAMSAKYNTHLVQLHDLFQNQLKYREAEEFCPEPVHPNHTGHLLIAHALFDQTRG